MLAVAIVAGGMMLATACQNNKQSEEVKNEAEEMISAKAATGDFEGAVKLIDSLEQVGAITPIRANRGKGSCYHYLDNPQKAEEFYRQAYNLKPQNKSDELEQFLSARNLADILKVKGDYEEALNILLPTIKMVEEGQLKGERIEEEYFNMLFNLSECQYHLDQFEESTKSRTRAYALGPKLIESDSTGVLALNVMENCFNMAATQSDNPDSAKVWLDRSSQALDYYYKLPTAHPEQVAYCNAFILQLKSTILYKLGNKAEAEKTFAEYLTTDFYQTETGKIGAAEYLFVSGQWDKAADHYEYVDTFFSHRDMKPTLDNIKEWVLPRYLANANAGRTTKTIDIGRNLCEILDTAIVAAGKDKAAELATIYDTQKKEAQIAQQQAEISHQRVIGLIAAIIALVIFFIIYTLIRRRAAARLAEVKAAQERIESELRIARDIQMSMVPSIFPEREGLDMYASMTPAKEVGGDLYGYLMQGDKLYFAVGDVSGKGVPASLFMAQATRLFLTLAKQGMMPAEICTRLNDALSGDDNESGMFVTFWLGLLDLQTGHLDFCNAGHNPPIIGGGDNQGDFLKMEANAPIGLWKGLKYEGEEIENIKGRGLLIYTDGLNEAENLQKEQFGDQRLLQILRNTTFSTAQQEIEKLKQEVDRHRNGAEPNDDLTMMCIHVK